jgi:hypothetical protein
MFKSSSVVWSAIAGVTQPLFKGGAMLHQRRAAVAAAQEAAANYKSTVITAFQNVSNSLYALQADADALSAENAAEQSAKESLSLVQAQYKSGRRELPAGPDRRTNLSKRGGVAGEGARAAFRRYGGVIPSTGRRLVESHRRRRQLIRLLQGTL